MMEIQEGAVYTTAEVAKFLKLSPVTVERKIRRGEMPGTKIGSEYRLLGDDILGLFRERKETKGEERTERKKLNLKTYHLGGVIGGLSRREIYEDR
ncbi:helix-turn-helix domain-containing protein [bacterium]|nr:helix-turn-helix domain-containing protein [bacterium]MBU1599100.1 helix-turn-helix domain-containing protein [bacterium]MBU2461338.1 helix-turn-helix domain-containing protein [bacterium]